ncbi:MAG: serine hydrolase domain-containing protein [bacterium]|jgi:CubicO group peptidase (beta-lactamase class C family)
MLGLPKRLIIASFCVCLILSPAAGGGAKEIVRGDPGTKLDEYLNRIAPYGFSGAVLVARDGETVLNKGYGLAMRSGGVANTSETVFSTGSITKQFTAAAIMVLEMQGKLNTGDKVSEHLGGVPHNKVDITLHHLLTHTAGVLFSTGDDYTIAHRDDTVKKILDSPLEFTPGERFEYSNAGYTLLAAIIEIVSGQPYEEFLREHLFEPAGMKFTGYRLPAWDERVVAHCYVGDADNGTPLEKDYPYWNLIGNGGILSTTGDLLKWHEALMGDDILSAGAKAKLYTPELNDYSYGWEVLETDRGTLIQHGGGSTLGNAAELRRYVDAGVVTVVFANADGEDVLFHGIRDKIETLAFGGDVDLPRATIELEEGELDKFAAVYDVEFGGTFTIKREGSGLRMTAAGHGAMNVLAFPELENQTLLHNDINERSFMLFDAAMRGDYSIFRAETGDQDKIDRFRQLIETRLDRYKDRTGTIRQVHIFGTLPGDTPDEVVTFVVLKGDEGGELVFGLHWSGGALIDISPAAGVPPVSMRLAPLSQTQFAGYNVGWGKGVTIDFDVDRHNSVRALTIMTASGDIAAVRR